MRQKSGTQNVIKSYQNIDEYDNVSSNKQNSNLQKDLEYRLNKKKYSIVSHNLTKQSNLTKTSDKNDQELNSKKKKFIEKRKYNLDNYILFCEKGVFNCKQVELRYEINGLYAYIKNGIGNNIIEVSSDQFEIYFNTRENLAYVLELNEQISKKK